MRVPYVATGENLADFLTKAQPPEALQGLRLSPGALAQLQEWLGATDHDEGKKTEMQFVPRTECRNSWGDRDAVEVGNQSSNRHSVAQILN